MDGERQPAAAAGALAFVLIVASGEKAASPACRIGNAA